MQLDFLLKRSMLFVQNYLLLLLKFYRKVYRFNKYYTKLH